MRENPHLLFVIIIFTALLPVTVWGYGFADYPGDRSYPTYAGPAGGYHYSGSLRLQTGMTGDGYYARALLDGLHPEDVHIFIQHNYLVLEIAQGGQHGLHNSNARGISQWQMHSHRQLQLPHDADWSRMVVTKKNGTMEIYIPRSSQYTPIKPSLKW